MSAIDRFLLQAQGIVGRLISRLLRSLEAGCRTGCPGLLPCRIVRSSGCLPDEAVRRRGFCNAIMSRLMCVCPHGPFEALRTDQSGVLLSAVSIEQKAGCRVKPGMARRRGLKTTKRRPFLTWLPFLLGRGERKSTDRFPLLFAIHVSAVHPEFVEGRGRLGGAAPASTGSGRADAWTAASPMPPAAAIAPPWRVTGSPRFKPPRTCPGRSPSGFPRRLPSCGGARPRRA